MSFIFYDTETTGTNKQFDQILQFAAVQTDADLSEIDRFEIRSRLQSHVAPSPGAMRVTGVGIGQLTNGAHPSHYEMVRSLRGKMLEWGTGVFAGYNSMDFDEPLLRQALYQTLHSPYLTNTNKNCRADVMALVQSAAYLETDAVVVPQSQDGKPSFKLDAVAPANGFNHANAHDALADVEATIHLCRLVRDRCPDCWSAFSRFAQKAAVLDFISEERVFLVLAHYFNKPCPYAVTLIRMDEKQSALAYVLDLAADLPALAALNDEKLAAKLKRSPKPVRKLKANAAPFLMCMDDVPDHVRQRLPSDKILERQVAWLDSNPEFLDRLMTIYLDGQEAYPVSEHLEQQIYEGFLSKADEAVLDEFHAAPWKERLQILERVSDPRYKALGHRLIYSEQPNVLPTEIRDVQAAQIASRLLGSELGGDPWLTLPKALEQTNDFLKSAQGEEHVLLSELAAYISNRIDQLASC